MVLAAIAFLSIGDRTVPSVPIRSGPDISGAGYTYTLTRSPGPRRCGGRTAAGASGRSVDGSAGGAGICAEPAQPRFTTTQNKPALVMTSPQTFAFRH